MDMYSLKAFIYRSSKYRFCRIMAEEVSQFQEDCCVICKLGFTTDKPVTVSKKGILSLISCSESRGCSELHSYLTESISKAPIGNFLVHKNCRRDFTNQTRIMRCNELEDDQLPQAKRLRSSEVPFNWKDSCMLCGEFAYFDSRHPEKNKIRAVTTLPLRDKLLECYDKRGDSWGSEVQVRLHGCIDLVAAEAIILLITIYVKQREHFVSSRGCRSTYRLRHAILVSKIVSVA